MAEFNVRSDNVDVERIMQQIRERIREKRGVDYTEEQIRELASVKLEKFLDPRNVRSELVQQFRQQRSAPVEPPPQNYGFEDTTIYESVRAPIRWIRKLLNPLLKLFFNPNPIIGALNQQSRLNHHVLKRFGIRDDLDLLTYEVLNNLVLELTRTSIEVKNLKMRLESMSTRLDFDERRARVLEGSVMYRPEAAKPPAPGDDSGDEEARRRRRRRRGRKRGPAGPGEPDAPNEREVSREDGPRLEDRPGQRSGAPAADPDGGPATGGSSGSSDES